MKFIKWAVLAVVLLVIVAVVIVVMSIDGIIRSTVQNQASSSLNLTTTLGGAHLSIVGGSLALSDLSIKSPEGFKSPDMFDLGEAKVGVSYGQLKDQPIHINLISLSKPKLIVEQSGGKLNIQAIQSQQSKTPTDSKGKETEPMKLIIDKLTVDGTDVSILPGIPGLDKPIDLTVPTIELDNVGNDSGAKNGVAIKDVATKLMAAIIDKAGDSDKLPPEVKVLLKGDISGLKTQVQQEATKALDAVKSGNPDAMKNAGKDLQNMFGGDKKKK